MKKSKQQYPEEIFVSLENKGTRDEYLQAEKFTDRLVQNGEIKQVARYRLWKVVKVTTVTRIFRLR
jgi:hypothetical protein